MTLLHSLSEWITLRAADFPTLAGLSVVKMGDDGDLAPPFLGLVETGSELYQQDNTTLYGVTVYQIDAELHTIPQDEDEEGTPESDEREIRRDLNDIIGNLDAVAWMDGINGWNVFDIRAASPTTEAQEGRRVTRWSLTIVASPL